MGFILHAGLLLLLHKLLRPDGEELAHFARVPIAKADRDATRVNEEVELHSTKKSNPLGPLNVRSLASIVDGTGRESVGGESKAAAAGTTERLGGDPGRCELCS